MMTAVQVNGTSLAYVERGRGETVVFVHGSASDHRTWHAQLASFASRFRCIAYSRRYHWPNQPIADAADYSMVEHVDDLQALVEWLGGTPVHLVGHSYGALLCLLLALREPGLVSTLILAEPPAMTLFVNDPPRPLQLLSLLLRRPRTAIALTRFGATGMAPAKSAARRGDMAQAVERFGVAVLGSRAYGQLSEERREQVRVNTVRQEFLGSGMVPLSAQALPSLRVPTLLLDGQCSPALFHRLTEALAKLLPDATHVEISGASHILHEDNPSQFDEAVLAFLKKRKRPGSRPVTSRAAPPAAPHSP